MASIDPLMVTALMFGAMILIMVTGLPLTFTLGVVSLGTVGLLWGIAGLDMIYHSTITVAYSFSLTAIPLFIFMGVVLQKSGIGEDLLDMVHRLMGSVPGGLAIGVVFICTLIAAMVGQTGPATLTMGVIALPIMLKRGYDKRMITGTIQAGGALGILIPPSVTMIMYAFLAEQSAGRLFAAGLLPGVLLAVLFMLYIFIRCYFQPNLGPPVPAEDRFNTLEKFKSLKALALPGLLIFLVLGLIIFGVTSPTEAAAVGALGALIAAAINRKLNWQILKDSVWTCGRLMGTIMWIIIPAVAFSKIYHGLGAQELIENLIATYQLGPTGILIGIIISYIILGMFLETGAILFLTIPLYVPVVISAGFDPIWFGIVYIMCMEMAYLTPPYGFNLFYMKAIVPPQITIEDIYISVIPFVLLQMIGLIIVVVFPQMVLWLPNLLFGS